MADLHEALGYLAPVDWTDVPLDDLAPYLSSAFDAGELICNSVPAQPNGTPFHSSRPHHKRPNAATTAKEMHPSAARSHPPAAEHEELQPQWGKPMKFSKKDNPHDVAVYKMAGHDRHGAWFARTSVHEGIGFTKFKKAMMREFSESLSVVGGPGAGAIRGLSADRRVDGTDVDGVGRLDVYQLSAQMPSPVTPREFTTLLLTTDNALTEKSAAGFEDGGGGKRKCVPRHYMIVSKPVGHPDAPERNRFVRGQYESVELIREIPLHQARVEVKSTPNLLSSPPGDEEKKGRERGNTIAFAESRGPEAKGEQLDREATNEDTEDDGPTDPELNPVEWIMITRSDPGGGIPRFLVERGTPDAMLTDVTKFLNWACGTEDLPGPDDGLDKQQSTLLQIRGDAQGSQNGILEHEHEPTPVQRSDTGTPSSAHQQGGGMFSQISHTIEAGLEAYAPAGISQHLHHYLHPDELQQTDDVVSDSDSSSINSFMSADEMRRLSTAHERLPPDSSEAISLASESSSSNLQSKDKGKLNEHEKEVLKLIKQREKLEQKLAKQRIEQETKLKKNQEKEQSEQDKQREKLEKEMKKTEERHKKEIEKLEEKKSKEEKKAEEKRRKKDEQSKMSLVTWERDEFRSQLDTYKRETALLRAQVEELQRENTALTNQLGKVGGEEAARAAQEEGGASMKEADASRKSAKSGGSIRSVDDEKKSEEKDERAAV